MMLCFERTDREESHLFCSGELSVKLRTMALRRRSKLLIQQRLALQGCVLKFGLELMDVLTALVELQRLVAVPIVRGCEERL